MHLSNSIHLLRGIDLQAAVSFDAQAFANQLESTATINETEGFVANVNTTFIETTSTNLQTQIQGYLDANLPNATVEDLIDAKVIIAQDVPFLYATLPYKTVVAITPVSVLSDSQRHKIAFEVITEAFSGADFIFTASFSELVGKRVTLSYVPATTSDQQTVDSFGGLYETPPYLIQVKPQLKVEGVVKAEGAAVGMGVTQSFKMEFTLPNIGTDQVQNNITGGGLYAVGLVPDRLQNDYSAVLQQRAQTLRDFVTGGGDRSSDKGLGEQLYLSAMTYFWEVDQMADALASQADMIYAKQPGEGVFALSLSVLNLFGVPSSVSVTGVNIDVDRAVYIALSKLGDSQIVRDFVSALGSDSSALEHAIIEQVYGVNGISAVKAIQLANFQGLRTYNVTSSNLSSVLPILQVSNAIKTDIQNAVNAGKEVIIPEGELQVEAWTGVGYIISDPVTGAAGYLISGGFAGGDSTKKISFSEVISHVGSVDGLIVILTCLLDADKIEPLGALFIMKVLAKKFFTKGVLAAASGPIITTVLVGATILAVISCVLSTMGSALRRKRHYVRLMV